ncbi:MAG TPA: N-acetylneuraminate synthase family protein [Vicinamibacterales bacterium]|nr:N-acetylneuraminate synthase family protein [Vicinamibacterales bacterium]
MKQLEIGGTIINQDSDCYVIAEVGHNHQGDLQTAKRLFLAAQEAGANAVKLQKRDNRSLFTREMYDRPYDNENSFGATYGAHREFLEFGEAEYRELQHYASEIGITFFATAFDFRSADFLARLDMPAFKMASGDLTNIPLLKHVAGYQKPMFVSTGGGTLDDVRRGYDAVAAINPRVCLMQCTAAYPPEFDELNLRVITTFMDEFPDALIGFGSHDSGIAMALVAFVLGARVVEKHFTLNRAMKGTDHAFSLEPVGMRKMVRDLRRARLALGDGIKSPYPTEAPPLLKMRKKLVANRDLAPGHVLTPDDVAIKSPGDGLPPYEWDNVIGRCTRVPVPAEQNIRFEDLEAEVLTDARQH